MMHWTSDGTGTSRSTRSQATAVTDWLGRTTTAAVGHHHRHQSLAGASGIGNGSLAGNAAAGRLVLTLTGWRRRALFGLLLTLAVIVIINLSLTLWLLRSMQFSLVSPSRQLLNRYPRSAASAGRRKSERHAQMKKLCESEKKKRNPRAHCIR